jgi:hypothetical protein
VAHGIVGAAAEMRLDKAADAGSVVAMKALHVMMDGRRS